MPRKPPLCLPAPPAVGTGVGRQGRVASLLLFVLLPFEEGLNIDHLIVFLGFFCRLFREGRKLLGLLMEPHRLSPWYLHENTLLRPWAPKRSRLREARYVGRRKVGAQAPRLRRVIRHWRNSPKQRASTHPGLRHRLRIHPRAEPMPARRSACLSTDRRNGTQAWSSA